MLSRPYWLHDYLSSKSGSNKQGVKKQKGGCGRRERYKGRLEGTSVGEFLVVLVRIMEESPMESDCMG